MHKYGKREGRGAEPGLVRDDGVVRIYGIHAVEAALRNPARDVLRLVLTDNAERRLVEALQTRNPTVDSATPRDLDRILGPDTVHQGAYLETRPLPEPSLEELAVRASDGPLVILDQVTDPHNVGAVLRSATVFGASGLVMPWRHSPPLDGALAKAASGALEIVPVALVQNLARAMTELKAAGVTLYGLDADADVAIESLITYGPVAFVLGAEGKGLRRLTRETCDRLCRIGHAGVLASLNVSNAAAVALHLAYMRRGAREDQSQMSSRQQV